MPKETKITVFQALTLLAQKYRGDEAQKEKYAAIKSLYLSGVRTEADLLKLNTLLEDEALADFEVSKAARDINEDPVRRYFESHLCHETLKDSLDKLDQRTLDRHFKSIFDRVPPDRRQKYMQDIMSGTREGSARTGGIEKEYAEGVRILRDPNSFQSLKPEVGTKGKTPEQILADRKEKMILLAMCSLSALRTGDAALPLDLYGRKGYVYDPVNRGRVARKDEAGKENEVRHFNLGIMRAYMPVPESDPLKAHEKAEYNRPADGSTYVEGAQMPTQFFNTQVTPFVNSISGTMLGQLRIIAKLMQEQKFAYQAQGKNAKETEEQLKNYFKSFVAYMIYNSGGHSMNEFLSVLQLPEVQKEFEKLPGFDKLTLETLFKEENDAAFERALDKAIQYNDVIVHKKQVHAELASGPGEDELQRARGKLKKAAVMTPEEKAQRDKEIEVSIDKAFKEYQSPPSAESREEAAKQLAKLLLIHVKQPVDPIVLDKQIAERMMERTEKFRQRIFSSFDDTLPNRLDKAWEVYTNADKAPDIRQVALSFLVYALDIKPDKIPPDQNLNTVLQEMMLQREIVRGVNPDFIPGKAPAVKLDEAQKGRLSPTDHHGVTDSEQVREAIRHKDLLDVNPLSKRKDRGELTGKKTIFLSPQEVELHRVLIRNGEFVQDGQRFDTSNSESHGKKGFAAFTLNVNGTLAIFPHIDHDATGIAHSSMNKGNPVVSAGEVCIKNGKLISITDHSGHYRPSGYSIYKTLEYFKKQGVDISDAKVLMLVDPGAKLNIESRKHPEHTRFYECSAIDFCYSYTKDFKQAVANMQSQLAEYQKPNFWTTLYKIKDWFTGSTLTSDRLKLAENLSKDLMKKAGEINQLDSMDKIRTFVKDLTALHEKTIKLNEELSRNNGKAMDNSGRLAEKLQSMRDEIGKLTGRVETLEKQRAQKGVTSDEEVLSRHDTLKGIGR